MYNEAFSARKVTLTGVPARAAVVRRRANQKTYAISAWDENKNIAVEVLIADPCPDMDARLGTVQPIPGTQTYSVVLAYAGVEPLRGLLESLSRNSRLVMDIGFDGSWLTSFQLRQAGVESDSQCATQGLTGT